MIERLDEAAFEACLPELAELLVDAVEDGASVGFLAGFDTTAARAWWLSRAPAVASGGLAVWVARTDGRVTGTISLAYSDKPNQKHRADVVKLAVLRRCRGQGLGRRLLETAEQTAAATGVTLLMLDTETASAAETLYQRTGWQRYGIVPEMAADPSGVLRDCSFFYKTLA
ncbi:GNAT family N-acetyltransferase [Actinoplanes sp. NBRC 103695]|uniref:GNAT family N-acetyltransferase n=1 Tax=Actinoplanes sp. NBRC 103695 TaxID=3032202 RepID=UPI0024A44954|nr:GNAT family N-acetyltransferase [Actinoplanes sp. NBRC 103695]GLY95171.1 N-acetyltransferase [Actinoplanes sp. NBRC 103695]